MFHYMMVLCYYMMILCHYMMVLCHYMMVLCHYMMILYYMMILCHYMMILPLSMFFEKQNGFSNFFSNTLYIQENIRKFCWQIIFFILSKKLSQIIFSRVYAFRIIFKVKIRAETVWCISGCRICKKLKLKTVHSKKKLTISSNFLDNTLYRKCNVLDTGAYGVNLKIF